MEKYDEDFKKLKEKAHELAHVKRLNPYVKYGHVGAALMTRDGNIYTGVAITCTCQIGFCAEHSAIAEMLKNNETEIVVVSTETLMQPILSKKTMKIVKENIIFAIAVKVLVLILSAIGISTMWEAVFADVGVSVIAIINSLRMLGKTK